jgi:uncharacterized protein YndB with AHSA1/START domain
MPSATDPVRSEVRIAAPPEVVFPYLTDPARLTPRRSTADRAQLA